MADLCLGTAQLGMAYGIHNKVGKLNQNTVFDILDTAMKNEIRVLDTASIYGDAEALLGEYLKERANETASGKPVELITKQCRDISGMRKSEIEKTIRVELEESLKRLQRKSVDAYLLHAYREIDNKECISVLQKLKEEKLIKKIGVSLYEVDEAEMALALGNVDYLQMPCSLFDQRGLQSGIFQKAKENNVTVFTRSAFLQGLLIMEPKEVPRHLQELVPYIERLEMLLRKYALSRTHAIVKFILSQTLIDYMVFGIETKEQMKEIINEKASEPLPEAFVEEIQREFAEIPERLILPVFWKG